MTEAPSTTEAQRLTLTEYIESLTGYEDLEIERHFGREVLTLSIPRGGRAIVYVLLRRQGLDETSAKDRVMNMPLREVDSYFASEDAPELDLDEDDEPATESGKGGGTPA